MRRFVMLTYIYFDVDECWLTSSVSQEKFKLQFSYNYANINRNAFCWGVNDGHVSINLFRVHITLLLPYNINNDRHSPVHSEMIL